MTVAANLLVLHASCGAEVRTAASSGGMIVSVSTPASEAGRSLLRQGGNAVDAAVATAFALAVTYPPAGNIGGGGFMLVLPAAGKSPVCVEYRETAPAAATERMFALDESRCGAKVAGVPGTVRGLGLAHREFGRLPWPRLVAPAIQLADEGFAVDRSLANSLNGILRDKESGPFTEMTRAFAPPNGDQWRAGDRLVQPDLGRTLRRIAHEGVEGFYAGPVAEAIVAEMKRGGGLITAEDLAEYRAHLRAPIHGTYRGYDVFAPPPPSSGGIALVQMLNVLETFELRGLGRDAPETIHLTVEAMRRAYLDRARYLGDSDFHAIPNFLTSKDYAIKLAGEISRERATSSEALAPDIPLAPEPDSTTHFSVVDRNGMAVANTYTLEQGYGSRVMVRGAGFLLNNEMGDFNWVPGHTDRAGRIGTGPNRIAPGKRMLSSQTPVLVLAQGNPVLVTGSPGGRTIINTVLGVVLNVLEFDMDLPTAVGAPRWHHQWLPDRVQHESVTDPRFQPVRESLEAMGHRLDRKPIRQGDAHSILVDLRTGKRIGVADGRT
ncbi:MAG: gamma-glutamyltransferase, partial [Planctomycetes bacterium]|nr:gamma-glutamyltransferase [Planctomycetota bacterium]